MQPTVSTARTGRKQARRSRHRPTCLEAVGFSTGKDQQVLFPEGGRASATVHRATAPNHHPERLSLRVGLCRGRGMWRERADFEALERSAVLAGLGGRVAQDALAAARTGLLA